MYPMSPSETVETPQVVTQSVSTFEIKEQLELLTETFTRDGHIWEVIEEISFHLKKLNKLLKKHFNKVL